MRFLQSNGSDQRGPHYDRYARHGVRSLSRADLGLADHRLCRCINLPACLSTRLYRHGAAPQTIDPVAAAAPSAPYGFRGQAGVLCARSNRKLGGPRDRALSGHPRARDQSGIMQSESPPAVTKRCLVELGFASTRTGTPSQTSSFTAAPPRNGSAAAQRDLPAQVPRYERAAHPPLAAEHPRAPFTLEQPPRGRPVQGRQIR